MISCIYDKHISNKYSIENYNMFMNDIIDDILMGKISSVENKIIIKGFNKKVIDTIKLFYKLADTLAELYPTDDDEKYYTVYRRMNFEFTNDTLIQPIPFSTSIVYEYIKNQCAYAGTKYIYIIDFLKNTRFVSIDNENEGKEIILPACLLKKTKTSFDTNITIYNCILINHHSTYV
jgi:hypothetical protein